jgi:hypothetical protein
MPTSYCEKGARKSFGLALNGNLRSARTKKQIFAKGSIPATILLLTHFLPTTITTISCLSSRIISFNATDPSMAAAFARLHTVLNKFDVVETKEHYKTVQYLKAGT